MLFRQQPQNYQNQSRQQPQNYQNQQPAVFQGQPQDPPYSYQPSEFPHLGESRPPPVSNNRQEYQLSANQEYQSQPPRTQNGPPRSDNQSLLSPSDMTFLVQTIKEAIREDLGKEIAGRIIKENLPANNGNHQNSCCNQNRDRN